MVFGGLVGGGTFEFDSPDSAGPDSPNSSPRHNTAFTSISRSRRQGKKAKAPEESDDRVRLPKKMKYFYSGVNLLFIYV
jgi:hypothetical protein